jgi:hypothetical protein
VIKVSGQSLKDAAGKKPTHLIELDEPLLNAGQGYSQPTLGGSKRHRPNPMSNESILYPDNALPPALLFAPTPKAAKRALEFFTAQINNDHTRLAYLNATRRFAHWCETRGRDCVTSIKWWTHISAEVTQVGSERARQKESSLRLSGVEFCARPSGALLPPSRRINIKCISGGYFIP